MYIQACFNTIPFFWIILCLFVIQVIFLTHTLFRLLVLLQCTQVHLTGFNNMHERLSEKYFLWFYNTQLIITPGEKKNTSSLFSTITGKQKWFWCLIPHVVFLENKDMLIFLKVRRWVIHDVIRNPRSVWSHTEVNANDNPVLSQIFICFREVIITVCLIVSRRQTVHTNHGRLVWSQIPINSNWLQYLNALQLN